ncbi:MAG: PIN domain protein [Candidatus Marinimicrobia bacterium]|nr:PIN domain protein [Candidatus Neomarinimicrobiota bacterium]MCF7829178.1 PIN domain protein [Candidatus Neomarinimicrobiota bacterium]MCF7881169.1 PIN domain protein [Candidatus Neomarinimicrobiota bacterium]
MKFRIYTDTSVIGGCFDPEFAEWSNQLLDQFAAGEKILVLSDLTLRELELAPDFIMERLQDVPKQYTEYVDFTNEVKALAHQYVAEGVLGEKNIVDAQHIALATFQRVDVLTSWNFRHIVHFIKVRQFNAVNLKFGYPTIEIRSPQEVV